MLNRPKKRLFRGTLSEDVMNNPSISRRQLTQWGGAALLASQLPLGFAQEGENSVSPLKFVTLYDGSQVPAGTSPPVAGRWLMKKRH